MQLLEFIGAFEAVLALLILIAIGCALTYKKKLNEEISSFISWFVINITLPFYMFENVVASFKKSDIKAIPATVAIPMLAIIICYILGFIIVKLFRVSPSRSGSMIVLTAQNNTIFMGLPVNLALFGALSVPYVLYYYMANTILFWTLGIFTISSSKSSSNTFLSVIKRVVSPPLFGLIFGLIALYFNIKVPAFVMDTSKYVGSMTTPLSMIFIGYILAKEGLKKIKIDRDVILGNICRFCVGPAVSIVLFTIFPLAPLMRNVFIVQAFMPVMASQTIIAAQYGRDSQYMAVMVSISTILSLIILPFVKVFFNIIF